MKHAGVSSRTPQSRGRFTAVISGIGLNVNMGDASTQCCGLTTAFDRTVAYRE